MERKPMALTEDGKTWQQEGQASARAMGWVLLVAVVVVPFGAGWLLRGCVG